MTVFDESSIESDNGLLGESDYEAAFDEASGYDESEARRRRGGAARAAAMRRQEDKIARRQELTRSARSAGPAQAPGPPQVAAQVRRVGLETRVLEDRVGSAIRAQSRRTDRVQYALALGGALGAAQALFASSSVFNNPVAKIGGPLAPLAVLQGTTPGGWRNPGLLAAGAVGVAVLGKELLGSSLLKSGDVADIRFEQAPTHSLSPGEAFTLRALAINRSGDIVIGTVPTLTPTGATADPNRPGRYIVNPDPDPDEVSFTATAGNITVPLILRFRSS